MTSGNRRLMILATQLRNNVKQEELNLWNWYCGTTACAVGHACQNPSLQQEGLGLRVTHGLDVGIRGVPTYKAVEGWRAVTVFFELDDRDATWLFDYESYKGFGERTPTNVADRIEQFVLTKENARARKATAVA